MNTRTFIFLLGVLGQADAALPPQPIEQHGACPQGYMASNGYCVPARVTSGFAVAKSGACPTGYTPQGHYCVATRRGGRAVAPTKSGCPYGYARNGAYCVGQ